MLKWAPPNPEDLNECSTEEVREILRQARREFEAYKQEVRATIRKPSKNNKNLDELCHELVHETGDQDEDLAKIVSILIKDKNKMFITPEVITSIVFDNDSLIKIGEDMTEAGDERKRQELIAAQKKKKKNASKPLARDGVKGNRKLSLDDDLY